METRLNGDQAKVDLFLPVYLMVTEHVRGFLVAMASHQLNRSTSFNGIQDGAWF